MCTIFVNSFFIEISAQLRKGLSLFWKKTGMVVESSKNVISPRLKMEGTANNYELWTSRQVMRKELIKNFIIA
jgi:hypothetical protein